MGQLSDWVARMRVLGLNATALILLFSLPGIWMAWSPAVLIAIVCVAALAAVLHCILVVFDEP